MGAPSSQRMQLLPPILAILVVLPLEEVRVRASNFRYAALVLSVPVVIMAAQNLYQFFGVYIPNNRDRDPVGNATQELAFFLSPQAPEVEVYFLGGDQMYFRSHPSLSYLWPEAHGIDLGPPYELPAGSGPPGTHRLFLLLPEELTALRVIEQRYPGGVSYAHADSLGKLVFYVYEEGKPG